MALSTRTAAQLRDLALAFWQTRYALRGKVLDISLDSDAYQWADAFSLLSEHVEAGLADAARDIFPDTASTAALERHASLLGLTRKGATAATLSITITGTVGSSYTTSNTLAAPDGTLYKPVSGGTLGSSPATISVVAQTSGASTTKPAGTVLTWQSAPSGINPTASVLATTSTGVDTEDDPTLSARVLAWWKQRPGAGNRADFANWALERPQVNEAYIYPLLHPTLGVGTLGAVTVCVLGPPGARILGSTDVQDVNDYIKGLNAYAGTGGFLTADMDPSDVSVVAATPQSQDVTVTVTLNSPYAFPFTGTATTTVGSSTTVLYLTSLPTGIAAGSYVSIPDTTQRGNFITARVTATNPVSNTITLDTALSAAPGAGVTVRPAPANWGAIRDAVLAVFDSLGPGPGTPPSARYPSEAEGGAASTLYQSALIAAVMGSPGVTGAPAGAVGVANASVTLVGATDPTKVVPAAKVLVTPGTITVVTA